MTPSASIVIAFHNGMEHLSKLPSKLNALTGGPFEVILVDDHSSDVARSEVSRMAEKIQHTVISLHLTQGPRGVATARNTGVQHASGEYVWFTDIDDNWSPEIVEIMLRAAKHSSADVVLVNARKVYASGGFAGNIQDSTTTGSYSGKKLLPQILGGEVQGHLWNKLFRRELLGSNPFPATRAHSDLGGMLGLAKNVHVVASVQQVLYTYELHAGSILNSSNYEWDDLPSCARTAQQATNGTSIPDALVDSFVVRVCAVPLLNEWSRRTRASSRPSANELRSTLLRMRPQTGLPEVHQIRSESVAFLRFFLGVLSPRVYAVLYRWTRRDHKSDLDASVGLDQEDDK